MNAHQFYTSLLAKVTEMYGDGLDLHWVTNPEEDLADEINMHLDGASLEAIVECMWKQTYA